MSVPVDIVIVHEDVTVQLVVNGYLHFADGKTEAVFTLQNGM